MTGAARGPRGFCAVRAVRPGVRFIMLNKTRRGSHTSQESRSLRHIRSPQCSVGCEMPGEMGNGWGLFGFQEALMDGLGDDFGSYCLVKMLDPDS